MNPINSSSSRFASFEAIHLNNTSIEKATTFWTTIIGMKLRKNSNSTAEFGTETKTLVVVHETATKRFTKGFSGLYHFAIHAPNKQEFASMLNRLAINNYPFHPVDHTMSKSLYLEDTDGINLELTLETPERFKKVDIDNGLRIEDANGNIKSATTYLDINEILKDLSDKNTNKLISKDTYIGHLHLYANSLEKAHEFYKKIGYITFNYLPQFLYADLGDGGAYQHRIALNSWHGINKPLAPKENAGMKHFQINFKTKEKLEHALKNVYEYEEKENAFWLNDATGNKIVLTHS